MSETEDARKDPAPSTGRNLLERLAERFHTVLGDAAGSGKTTSIEPQVDFSLTIS